MELIFMSQIKAVFEHAEKCKIYYQPRGLQKINLNFRSRPHCYTPYPLMYLRAFHYSSILKSGVYRRLSRKSIISNNSR